MRSAQSEDGLTEYSVNRNEALETNSYLIVNFTSVNWENRINGTECLLPIERLPLYNLSMGTQCTYDVVCSGYHQNTPAMSMETGQHSPTNHSLHTPGAHSVFSSYFYLIRYQSSCLSTRCTGIVGEFVTISVLIKSPWLHSHSVY